MTDLPSRKTQRTPGSADPDTTGPASISGAHGGTAQARRHDDPDAYPLRTVVVGEIQGLVVGSYQWRNGHWDYNGGKDEFDQRWAEVEHIESALRLSLARRLGRVARWADWIEIDPPSVHDATWL